MPDTGTYYTQEVADDFDATLRPDCRGCRDAASQFYVVIWHENGQRCFGMTMCEGCKDDVLSSYEYYKANNHPFMCGRHDEKSKPPLVNEIPKKNAWEITKKR